MAYNNYFPAGYQPQMVYPQQYTQIPQVNQQQNTSGLIWVQGEGAAKSYLVAPGNTVALFDNESQTIYIKSADASGMPSIKILDYTMRDAMPQKNLSEAHEAFAKQSDVDSIKAEIEVLKAKLEASE